MFVDRVQIEVRGGRGGNGCSSLRRERHLPRGGPDGGNGGHGGNVIILAADGVDNLSCLAHRKFWRADSGRHGQGSNRNGRGAHDLIIQVPFGTVVYDAKHDLVLRDLTTSGDQVVAARGGKGGRGNTQFKTPTNRTPREWTPGEEGEVKRLVLELKSIADAGLVGKPNAGKSTMLSRLSHARPEIAAYPFTTKHPNLGRVQIDMDRSFIVADIPGLIEGAHAGAGLGHEFLRHIQRTGVLVHLVEPFPMDGTSPHENYQSIREELVRYDGKLRERPEIVAVTKAELPGASDVHAEIAQQLEKPPLLVSAVTGAGLRELVSAICHELQDARASE